MTTTLTAATRNAKKHGMNVSAADLIIVTIAITGERASPDTPFTEMATRIKAARPFDWADLMNTSMSERLRDSKLDWEAVARIVKSIHLTA